jgi:PKD repeat protein
MFLVSTANIFADETLQCRDGSKIDVRFYGSTIFATSTSSVAQTFDVIVLFKDKTSDKYRLTVTAAQVANGKVYSTGFATKDTGKEIAEIVGCTF